MTTIITASESQAPIYGMWVLVAMVVIAALGASFRTMRRARRQHHERTWVNVDAITAELVEADDHAGDTHRFWLNEPIVFDGTIVADELTVIDNLVLDDDFWNTVVGFDREGTEVWRVDLVDGNIAFDDVITTGGVYWTGR